MRLKTYLLLSFVVYCCLLFNLNTSFVLIVQFDSHATSWERIIQYGCALGASKYLRIFITAEYRWHIVFVSRAEHCSRQLDVLGDQTLHCRDDHGMKGGRHDRIRDLIFKEAQKASLSPTMEMPGLVPGSQSRPADVFIPSWVDGKKTAFDISVVSPTQDAIVDRAADYAAAAIEMQKT